MPHRTFLRKGRWQIEYKDAAGRRRYESAAAILEIPAATVTAELAQQALAQRLGEAHGGHLVAAKHRRLTFAHLAEALKTHLGLKGLKRQAQTFRLIDGITADYGAVLARDITAGALEVWAKEWRGEGGLAPATVNKRMVYVAQALKLAVERGQLAGLPRIPQLRVRNARQGFVTREVYQDLARALGRAPQGYQDTLAFLWESGWRREEATGLRWEDVDLAAGQLRAVETKNGDTRVLPLEGPLRALLEARWARRRLGVPWVFHRDGRPIQGRRFLAWFKKAAAAIGRPELIVHDLRRSAVREMELAGVPRAVAMKITGHRSPGVYSRYAIMAADDLAEGLRRRAQGGGR